ncbi:MAG: hypothetical protein M3N02_01410 [Pseudomonadota bacterium]|nr:hypothetical protein [Pseudomonadota bacterium]
METGLRLNLAFGLLLVAAPVTAASAQDVAHFLVRVDTLLARGPFALLSPDFYRLKHLVEANGEELKAEYARKQALRQATAFCPPVNDKPRVNKIEYLQALRAVPASHRATTDTKDVLRALLEKKYPCRGGLRA